MSTAISIDVTLVTDTPQYPLGAIFTEPATTSRADANARANAGERQWVYVYNDEAATDFVQGNIVKRDAATVTHDGILTDTNGAASVAILGVAQHTIGEGQYGWILKRGIGEVLAGTAGVTANTAIVPDGAVAGAAEDMAAGEEHWVFGYATEAAASGALATCWINCLGS